MQMVFQDPFASLNSKMSVQELIEEPLIVRGKLSKAARKQAVIEMIQKVGLQTEDRQKYPHEFSGGQRQRISIARELVLRLKFVIGNEAVYAFELFIQDK